MRLALLGTVLALAGCGEDAGPTMRPGDDCMRCHSGGRAPTWTVAGTVYGKASADADAGSEGARVLVTDAAGKTLTLTTNSAGNFYTAEAVRFPLTVAVESSGSSIAMEGAVSDGGCNSCHSVPGTDGAAGRVYGP